VAERVKGNDEKKVLDMIKSVQSLSGDIHPYKMDLESMKRSHGDESFQEILMNVVKLLVDDPIRDSMVCNNQREEISNEKKPDYKLANPKIIDWSLETKLQRVKLISKFLNRAEIDFVEILKTTEQKIVFFQTIKKKHDELCTLHNNYQSIILFNETIRELVRDVHKVSEQEIKHLGNVSSHVFYSSPLKGAGHFILMLSKKMYEKNLHEKLSEDTVLQLSGVIMEALAEVQTHRDELRSDNILQDQIQWTMDSNTVIDPIKRVLELMPELIRNNESDALTERMLELSRVILHELEFAKDIEQARSNEDELLEKFVFSRKKLIQMVEEFSVDSAMALATEYEDIENTTRLCLLIQDYEPLYRLLGNTKVEARSLLIQESMQWLVDDYLQQHRKRKMNEPFTYKLHLMDIYEGEYDAELEQFIKKYPKLRLIFAMKKGDFKEVVYQCKALEMKSEDKNLKKLFTDISEVNQEC